MSKNKKNKKMPLENHTMPLEPYDNDAVKMECQEPKMVSEKGKKSFGRKV